MEAVVAHYRESQLRCADLEPAHRYNNYVKAYLIQTYMRPGAQVLDLACGKGGDLQKYKINKAGSYFGVDAVPQRIEEAIERHRGLRCMFAAAFEIGDFSRPLYLQSSYDFVSCQFALHYAWESEASAMQLLRNAVDVLSPGGAIVLTFPDAERIVDLLFKVVEHPDEHHYSTRDGATITYHVGGPRHHLRFETELPFLDFVQSFQTRPFGHQYIYFQQGAVPGVPEYLVEPGHLRDMCASLGLRVELEENFAFFKDKDTELSRRMRAAQHMDAECDNITRLYKALVLTKGRKRARTGSSRERTTRCNDET
jgi:mRNA (guanine-N7-)-methyltransferase